MGNKIEGVIITPLKIISHPLGDIYHALKCSDEGFNGFGESYFSTVHKGDIKGWKKHLEMTLNLIVPVGKVKFVIYDERKTGKSKEVFEEVELSLDNYMRLTIPPGLWVAFQGMNEGLNLLQNIANIEHRPEEALRCELNQIPYSW